MDFTQIDQVLENADRFRGNNSSTALKTMGRLSWQKNRYLQVRDKECLIRGDRHCTARHFTR